MDIFGESQGEPTGDKRLPISEHTSASFQKSAALTSAADPELETLLADLDIVPRMPEDLYATVL